MLIERLVQGALRKEVLIAIFVERLKTPTLESITERFGQYLEQFTETLYFWQIFADRRLSTRWSTKGAAHCSFRRAP